MVVVMMTDLLFATHPKSGVSHIVKHRNPIAGRYWTACNLWSPEEAYPLPTPRRTGPWCVVCKNSNYYRGRGK